MKIAVASIEDDIAVEIAQQAGRAPFYLIFENGKLVETMKNPFSVGGGGAGHGVAKMLADKSINKVIAGKFGDKMIVALQGRGVDFEEKEGKIQEIV
ncbi:MAG: NifB/NifX family molybdenum-iron cluster-binding protein [Patescibacteria group bacterium]|nr:NifB/NifX family molybdenum-iron cluster-binding protein [Patescibacteria group bacterium]